MVKVIVKYVFALAIFMLGFSTETSALNVGESHRINFPVNANNHPIFEILQHPTQAGTFQSAQAFSKSHPSTLYTVENEVEEDETETKKHGDLPNQSNTLLYASILGLFLVIINNCLIFCERFYYFISYQWHLIFGVLIL